MNELTSSAIRTVTFTRSVGGYDRASVEGFLHQVADLVESYESAHRDRHAAAKLLTDAEAAATRHLDQARAEADELLAHAQAEAQAARTQAEGHLADSSRLRAEAEALLSQAQARVEQAEHTEAQMRSQMRTAKKRAEDDLSELLHTAAQHRSEIAALSAAQDQARATVRELAATLARDLTAVADAGAGHLAARPSVAGAESGAAQTEPASGPTDFVAPGSLPEHLPDPLAGFSGGYLDED